MTPELKKAVVNKYVGNHLRDKGMDNIHCSANTAMKNDSLYSMMITTHHGNDNSRKATQGHSEPNLSVQYPPNGEAMITRFESVSTRS